MNALVLRPVTEADRPALLDLWVEAWAPVLPQIDFAARRDWFAEYLRGLETGGAVTLVAVQQVPAGFINYHPVTGYIDQIAVGLQWQGHGIARAFLAAAKQACPHGLNLKVNQQNPRALRLYQRAGFVVTGEGVGAASGMALWEMEWTGQAD